VTLRIVGIGEPMAGDDAVGIRVIERLRELGAPAGATLHALRDPSELATLLGDTTRVMVVDAVLDPERAGQVELMRAGDIVGKKNRPISSHGVDALTALEIGRVLATGAFPEVSFVTIAIDRPRVLGAEVTEKAAAAVEVAARLVMTWAHDDGRATARGGFDA
jgi:hydrogenase maturation protease